MSRVSSPTFIFDPPFGIWRRPPTGSLELCLLRHFVSLCSFHTSIYEIPPCPYRTGKIIFHRSVIHLPIISFEYLTRFCYTHCPLWSDSHHRIRFSASFGHCRQLTEVVSRVRAIRCTKISYHHPRSGAKFRHPIMI